MLVMPLLLSAILASDAIVTDIRESDKAAYHESLECRAYAELAISAFRTNSYMTSIARKEYRYWSEESERIGARSKLEPETVRVQTLVIKLEAERFDPIFAACLLKTPKGALR